MTIVGLLRRSLRHHWRIHLAVVLSAAAGTAALSGALVVGDSMRGSLAETALGQLGAVAWAVESARLFRDGLADEAAAEMGRAVAVAPILKTSGSVATSSSGGNGDGGGGEVEVGASRANRVQVFGVDERFWRLAGGGGGPGAGERVVWLNEALAGDLGAGVGDDVILRVERQAVVPVDSLLGRPDDTVVSLRLKVGGVVARERLGDLAMRPRAVAARNAFVAMDVLQRAVKLAGKANVLAVGRVEVGAEGELAAALGRAVKLGDYGVRVRQDAERGYVSVESENLLLEDRLADAAREAAREFGGASWLVLGHLANSIERTGSRDSGGGGLGDGSSSRPGASSRPAASVPYSAVVAIEPGIGLGDWGEGRIERARTAGLGAGEILLNEWTSRELGAGLGDEIELRFFVSRGLGALEEAMSRFRVAGFVPMSGWGADPGWAPAYKGITDAKRLTDWDPPFAFDLTKIRDQDEAYWEQYRAAPKAFIGLAEGQRLWTRAGSAAGRLTSVRVVPRAGQSVEELAGAMEGGVLRRLNPAEFGLRWEDVRGRALGAAGGSTDFAGLFLGLSCFLIAAAAMLVALLFRLGVDRRGGEAGLMLAVGLGRARVRRIFLAEGAVLAGLGALVGTGLAVLYAEGVTAGMRAWGAAGTGLSQLRVHEAAGSLGMGLAGSWVVAMGAVVWGLRGMFEVSPRALLAGAMERTGRAGRSGGLRRVAAWGCLGVGIGAPAAAWASQAIPQTGAFFAAGFGSLGAGLFFFDDWMRRGRRRARGGAAAATGSIARRQLAVRSVARQPRRSFLCAALVACASFVLVAVGANRPVVEEDSAERSSGTGGFGLMAESAIALPYDLATEAGRESLGLSRRTRGLLENAAIVGMRRSGGDDASCLNLYRAGRPRILGAPRGMIERGGFRAGGRIDDGTQGGGDAWSLLDRTFEDGAVAAIGDENTVRWLLHLGVGQDLAIEDEAGRPLKLRIVATLAGSVLQGELLIAESAFIKAFPSATGQGFFLIEGPAGQAEELMHLLEADLSDYGFDAMPTAQRLAEFLAVEDMYIRTFELLGGLGMVLGTAGLGAVVMRNLLERRGELALMQALGFRRRVLEGMVLGEHAMLLIVGLGTGVSAAMIAVAPRLVERPGALPWGSLGMTVGAVACVGLGAAWLAMRVAMGGRLLGALRSE